MLDIFLLENISLIAAFDNTCIHRLHHVLTYVCVYKISNTKYILLVSRYILSKRLSKLFGGWRVIRSFRFSKAVQLSRVIHTAAQCILSGHLCYKSWPSKIKFCLHYYHYYYVGEIETFDNLKFFEPCFLVSSNLFG